MERSREVREGFHETPKEMQESWVDVEEGHIPRESSSGDVTKMIADAVKEDSTRQLMESHFHSEDAPQFSTMSEEMQEDERAGESILYNAYSRLLRGMQDLLHYLFNPVVIASHLAAFGIGFCVGRRLIAS